ncbi:MAG: UDP-N-acetylmuramoyl-L-alanyl-D-glutamate--2,6-diaminopimelate ligase [Alphaproteobacteria bacterium]
MATLSAWLGRALSKAEFAQFGDPDISFMTDDSRRAQKGGVYVFDVRIHRDAHAFIDAALEAGSLVVSNADRDDVIFEELPGAILARYAKAQFPNLPAHCVAVTGTNGKASTAWFFHHLLAAAGYKAASMGTLGVYVNGTLIQETGYTSPTALKTHEILHNLHAQGVTHVCLEASSHALALGRLDGVPFCAAALTNITQDHLDFHGDMDAYATAKMRLFTDVLAENGVAVANPRRMDNWGAMALAKERGVRVLTAGSANAELVVEPLKADADGLTIEVRAEQVKAQVKLPLVGAFQAENVASALGLAWACGVPLEKLVTGLPKLLPVPGRMEMVQKIKATQSTVVVDYAHTPDALERVLGSLRPLVPTGGKLWCVFGCGGDRDNKKRPIMGSIVAKLADVSVVTDDNPRTEDAAKIRAQVLQGADHELEMPDRRTAIAHAINNASDKDIVLIAGKGHESGQIIGKITEPFDDRLVAKEVLAV